MWSRSADTAGGADWAVAAAGSAASSGMAKWMKRMVEWVGVGDTDDLRVRRRGRQSVATVANGGCRWGSWLVGKVCGAGGSGASGCWGDERMTVRGDRSLWDFCMAT